MSSRKKEIIYFSHRGANTQRVQNTVDAFALAHAQGARCFELDVHLLKDGNLAVHHDYSLLSTAGEDVKLADLTAADLKKYPLQNPFTQDPVYVPLLQEILPVIVPGLEVVNIELKNDDNVYPGLEKGLLDLLASYADLTPKILFSSFDYGSLVRVRERAPQARIGLLTRKFDVKQALSLRAESVHINKIRFTPQIAQICHENGLKVYLYVVNDPQEVRQFIEQGVDGFFTDRMDLFV